MKTGQDFAGRAGPGFLRYLVGGPGRAAGRAGNKKGLKKKSTKFLNCHTRKREIEAFISLVHSLAQYSSF